MAMQKEGVVLAVEGASQFISQLKQAGITWDNTTNRFRDAAGKFVSAATATDALQKATVQTTGSVAPLAAAIEVLTGAIRDYTAALQDSTQAEGQFGKKKDDTTENAKKSTGVLGQFFKGFGLGAVEGMGFNAVLGVLTGGIGTLGVIAGQAVTGGIAKLVKGFSDLAEATKALPGIEFQFRTMTQEFEGGSNAMLNALTKSSSGMISQRDLMQKYNSAASLVSRQFAEQLPQALTLLTKTSMATGKSMDYLFDSFVRGVGRASPLVLDNLEIQSSLAAATAHATKMFGKQEDQLTESEKQMAMAAYTMERLEAVYGAFPDVAETAAAQAMIFDATMQNIKDTLGQFLLPAFTAVKQGINALVGAFNGAISEGGAFYPILVQLGAVLSLVADGFRYLATEAANWLGNLEMNWTEKVGGIVESAITWGAEIVTNFAVGMIDAANTVLTWAMQQIQNILFFWLAPGSPPKIAPDLDKWGMAAFESYLQGMTSADFGILERIQSPLKKILEGPEFADASKAIAKALAGGDREGALAVLTKSSKIFGDDIAELARREFALADATEAVTIAENALTEAQNKATAAQERAIAAQERAAQAGKKVSAETMTYNRMLREGSGKEALEGQLERIHLAEREAQARRDEAKAAQEAADAAKIDVGAAKTGVDEAKARVDVLKEQVEWQKRFLEQLFGIQDALTEQEREAAKEKATKGGKPIGVPEAVLPPAAGGIGGAIASAIEAAKQRIKDSLGGIWQMIKTEFTEKWNNAVARLGDTWDAFKEVTAAAWNRIKERILGIWEGVKLAVTTGWDAAVKKLGNAWDGLVKVWVAVRDWAEEHLLPILNDLETLGLLALESALIILGDAWDNFKTNVLEPFHTWLDNTFVPTWEELKKWYETDFVPFLETTFVQPWDAFRDKMTTEIIPLLENKLVSAFETLGEKISLFKTDFLDTLNDGLEVLEEWLGKVHEKLGNLIERWQAWVDRKKDETNLPESPETPYSRGLRLAADQMERIARVSMPMMNRALAYQPAGAGSFYQPAGTTNNTQSNAFNFNATVNNGMDAAQFEALVLRSVRKALSPGAAR